HPGKTRRRTGRCPFVPKGTGRRNGVYREPGRLVRDKDHKSSVCPGRLKCPKEGDTMAGQTRTQDIKTHPLKGCLGVLSPETYAASLVWEVSDLSLILRIWAGLADPVPGSSTISILSCCRRISIARFQVFPFIPRVR